MPTWHSVSPASQSYRMAVLFLPLKGSPSHSSSSSSRNPNQPVAMCL
jgi:hypothetical protein